MVADFTKRVIWLACLMLVLSTTFAFGQGIVTGSMAGTVIDPQKAVITGAKVVAKNTGTGLEFKATTNDQGYFSIRSIPAGTYHVAVEASNFKKLEIAAVVIETGLTNDLGPLTLALGSTAETITVEAAAPLIETTTSQGGATFTAKTTQDLPLGGGFDQLAFFTPGVVAAGGANFTNNNGAQFAANGQRDRSNNFQIDGQYNNDNSVAGPAFFFGNQDALQEVQVITNNFGVEYGRNSGTQVNYVTKSGTNNFHGSMFEYFTGSFADSLTNDEKSPLLGVCLPGQTPAADGCTSPVVPRYTENRWGGTFGGPILPNKIFFFTAFLQDTAKSGGGSFATSALTPTPTGLAQLATCYPGNVGVSVLNAIGPYSSPSGNPVPVNPHTVSVGGITGLATPCTVEVGGVSRHLPGIYNDYEVVGRTDFALSSKDQLFVRYNFQQQLNTGAFGTSGTSATIAGGGEVDVAGRNQQVALDWTRNWTSHIVNQVRMGYVRLGAFFQGGAYPNCTVGTFASGACPTLVTLGGGFLSFGEGNNIPQDRVVNNTQWQDNASWQHGRHIVKFGGEYDRQRSPDAFLPQFNGQYTFSGLNTYLANTATQLALANGSPVIPFKEQDVALYVGDDWRIKDNLTINIGMRWEFNQMAINLLNAESTARQLNPATAFWNTSLPLSVTTVPQIPNVWHNFAPNFGFAWTPHMLEGLLGHDKTVIRGGFRMAYDPAFYNIFLNIASSAPTVNAGTITATPLPWLVGPFGSDVRGTHLADIPTGGNPGARNQTRVTPDFHNPYAEEWSLGIQREVTSRVAAEVRYVGTHTIGEFQTINGNPVLQPLITDFPGLVPAGVTPCATAGTPGFASHRMNCNFTNLRIRANSAYGRYNSLQSQLKLTSWHGFTGVVAYTWSKNIDNASEIFSTLGPNTVAGAQNPFNTGKGEEGLSALDYPHNLTVFWQYDLPFARGQQGMMGKIFGGWSFAGTYRYLSGQLWSPVDFAGFNSDCQNTFDNTFFTITSTCRPFMGNPGAPVDTVGQCTNAAAADCGLVNFYTGAATTKAAVHWIYDDNVAAKFFGTPYGNTSRNPGVRGDTVNNVNFNLIKSTRVSERVSLKLEANLLNAFNRNWLGTPDPYISDGNFASSPGSGSFGNTFFNTGGGGSPPFGTGGVASAVGTGLAQRRLILGAHISF